MTTNKKSTRYYSSKQERKVAKYLNGRTTLNSGAAMFNGGDVKTDLFCIECKTAMTEKQSMSIKKDWIDKLKEETFGSNRPYWTLAFNFGLENGENFYIIDEKLFKRLQTFLEEENNEY